MTDHARMRLGKRHPKRDARVPALSRYTALLPAAPATCDYSGKLKNIGMMVNDSLGDCTCAAVGHAIQVWTSQSSDEVTIPDAAVVSLYEAVGHYNPAVPSSDQGAVESEVLDYWLRNPVAGHAITGYATLEPGNLSEVRDAVWMFGGAYIGLALPISAQGQGSVWSVPPGGPTGQGQPGSWGGHAVFVTGYDERGLTFVTWGALQRMTWEFWSAYCDEAYAIEGQDWFLADGSSVSGFQHSILDADMAAIKGGVSAPRSVPLEDAQLWMIADAIYSKLDGADDDKGVVGDDADSAARSAKWQALLDYLQLPRTRPGR